MSQVTDQLAEITSELHEIREVLVSMQLVHAREQDDRQRRRVEREREFAAITGSQPRRHLHLVGGAS